jgi:hypothetical protein
MYVFVYAASPGRSGWVRVVVRSTPSTIIEVGQQISWLRIVLDIPSISKGGPGYGTAHMGSFSGKRPAIKVSVDICPYDAEDQQTPDPSYWLLRHSRRIIAQRFPVAARDSTQMGLEVTIPALHALIPTRIDYTGTLQVYEWFSWLLMQGSSTLFVLHDKGLDSLHWHWIADSQGHPVRSKNAGKIIDRHTFSNPDFTVYNRHFVNEYASLDVTIM